MDNLNYHIQRNTCQGGFTLVEIAIVLVIIGLLLGGVIKGREMIANAKFKQLIAMTEELAVAIHSYHDKYGALPGDDPNASANLSGGIGGCVADDINDGNGNGLIDEAFQASEHLACANLIKGSYDGTFEHLIVPPYGTRLLIGNVTLHGYVANAFMYYELPTEIAKRLDTSLDDGIYNSGNVRAPEDYTKVQTVVYFY